ncbi:MAG: S8 family serine peptidase [Saonia sp.]
MDYKEPTKKGTFKGAFFLAIFLTTLLSFGQSKEQLNSIKEQYRSSKINLVSAQFQKEFDLKEEKVLNLAKSNGWEISKTLPNGGYTELQDIGSDGTPLYYMTLNDNVSRTSRANTLYETGILNLGINGEGMHVGVWDSGIALTTHQEFDARLEVVDQTDEVSLHATRVMGTLIASGVKNRVKGVAYKANALTGDWKRDKIEVSEAAANGLLLSNHSYGINPANVPDWYFGSYIRVSQDWDKIMFNAPYYLMVTAAGNAQKVGHNTSPMYGSTSNGFDLMLGFATSKNGITVAAADTDIDGAGNLLSATVSNYSSFGPLDDGRIKPDIAGIGSNVYSTSSSNNKAYDKSSGTSMAAPGVTGSMLLLQQYYEKLNKNYMKAATLKGLVLHSADDVDLPGPDYKMGWGIMNSKRAAEIIVSNDYQTIISEEVLNEGNTYSIKVRSNGKEPLAASISWTDPASGQINKGNLNDISAALVDDLDIRIHKDGELYYPWKLSAANAAAPATKGDNKVDPFEKIDIANPSGEYTIEVTHKGTLNGGQRSFSIVISGIAVTQCTADMPSGITITEPEEKSLVLQWTPMADALFEVQYKLKTSTEWITSHTNDNSLLLENLIHGNEYELRLRTSCTVNMASEYSARMGFTFSGRDTELEDLDSLIELTVPNFSVYPNPTTERIVLEGSSNILYYHIVNTSGITVKEGNLINEEINVANLSSGLYIISVQYAEGRRSTKFYKN